MGWKVVIILYGWLGWCGEVRMWELRASPGISTWLYNMRLAAPHQGLRGGETQFERRATTFNSMVQSDITHIITVSNTVTL
jgi:hypothetical protein